MHRVYFGDRLCATTNPFECLYGLFNFVRGMRRKSDNERQMFPFQNH